MAISLSLSLSLLDGFDKTDVRVFSPANELSTKEGRNEKTDRQGEIKSISLLFCVTQHLS